MSSAINDIEKSIKIEKLSGSTILCDSKDLRRAYELVLNGQAGVNAHTMLSKVSAAPIWRGKIGKNGKWCVAGSVEELIKRLEDEKDKS